MLALGTRAEREVVCLLTDMDQPLGAAVGNALEVREALETVRGQRPAGLHRARARRVQPAARALGSRHRRGRGPPARRGGRRRRLGRGGLAPLDRGAGRRRPTRARFRRAPVVREVTAPAAGYVARLGAIASATPRCISAPGGGRRTTRSTTRSASSATRSAATRSRPASLLAEVHARTRPRRRGRGRRARRVRARPRAARAPLGAARGRRLGPRRLQVPGTAVRGSTGYRGAWHPQLARLLEVRKPAKTTIRGGRPHNRSSLVEPR